MYYKDYYGIYEIIFAAAYVLEIIKNISNLQINLEYIQVTRTKMSSHKLPVRSLVTNAVRGKLDPIA